MGRGLIAILGAAAGLLAASSVEAGFYDPVRPASPLITPTGPRALPWELFRDQMSEILRIADPNQPSKLRQQSIARRDLLLARGGAASADELAELGLLQWRLRDERALETLARAKARDPRGFWPLINLGTYYQATGQLHEAESHLGAALASFPSPWPGNPAAGAWFRQCERAQMSLLRSRLREASQRGAGRIRPPTEVDSLFPVRFAGPGGEYEAGKLPDGEQGKLPADAVATVQQLLLWFPEDARLLWLLGELYNATGDIRSAEQVFDECVGSRRFESPTLRDRRRIVKSAVAALPAEQPASAPSETFLPDTVTLWVVSGIGGAIVSVFFFLQILELARRRRR